ncbi:hypothetical protein CEXT_111031 [Caerostris extrusa]|uniref:Uncharacterized protein n=1 Tax=Caerostris extrusa TaxID=172846 RepID=A0AAV4X5I8_CAEEX|nr:hypothetical protein CEXT_111031 [Caerostris extrusa]
MGIINTARNHRVHLPFPALYPPTPARGIHHMRGISNVIWDSFLKHFKHLWRDSSLDLVVREINITLEHLFEPSVLTVENFKAFIETDAY